VLCSSAAHANKCFAFSHTGTICDMHTAVGAGGTYGSAGWTFHKKTVTPAPVTTQAPVSGGGDLAKYDDPIQDVRGKHLAGTGVYETDNQYEPAATASAAGCAAVCSAPAHAAGCAGFSFKLATKKHHKNKYPCRLYSKAGLETTRTGTGYALYKKKAAVKSGGGLEVFADPVDDSKGRYLKQKGQYPSQAAATPKTVAACATLCNSAAHAAGRAQKQGETCYGSGFCGCYGFSFLASKGKCELHSEVGANYNLFKAGSTVGWQFYKYAPKE